MDKILSEEKILNGKFTKLDKKSKDDANKDFEVLKKDLNEKLGNVLAAIEKIPESKSIHCGMRDKSSMFWSAIFKTRFFYVVFNAELNGTILILCFCCTIIDLLWPSWATVGQ